MNFVAWLACKPHSTWVKLGSHKRDTRLLPRTKEYFYLWLHFSVKVEKGKVENIKRKIICIGKIYLLTLFKICFFFHNKLVVAHPIKFSSCRIVKLNPTFKYKKYHVNFGRYFQVDFPYLLSWQFQIKSTKSQCIRSSLFFKGL